MVSYPIIFPDDLGVGQFSIKLRNSVARTESPFSFAEQVYDFGGEIWQIDVTMPLINRPTAEIFNSFIFKLRGRKGTFLFPIPGGETPRGVGGGTPVVDGGSQTGDTLNIRGAPVSTTGWLKAGDWINLGSGDTTRLYKALEDVDTDTSGDATITLAPNLRTSPSDGDSVTITSAKGLFRLSSNLNGYDINSDSFYSLSFSAQEAL